MSEQKIRKPRRNLPAQEKVVSAIWNFARFQQDSAVPKCTKGIAYDGFETAVNLDAIGTALASIMEAFGYVVTSIQ